MSLKIAKNARRLVMKTMLYVAAARVLTLVIAVGMLTAAFTVGISEFVKKDKSPVVPYAQQVSEQSANDIIAA